MAQGSNPPPATGSTTGTTQAIPPGYPDYVYRQPTPPPPDKTAPPPDKPAPSAGGDSKASWDPFGREWVVTDPKTGGTTYRWRNGDWELLYSNANQVAASTPGTANAATTPNTPAPVGGTAAPTEQSELAQAYADWESKYGKGAPLPVGVVDQIYRKYHPTVNPPPATGSTTGTTANPPAPPPITKTKPLDPEIYKKLVKEGYIIPETGATTGTTANVLPEPPAESAAAPTAEDSKPDQVINPFNGHTLVWDREKKTWVDSNKAQGGNPPAATSSTTGITPNTPAGPPTPPGGDYSGLDGLGKAISNVPDLPAGQSVLGKPALNPDEISREVHRQKEMEDLFGGTKGTTANTSVGLPEPPSDGSNIATEQSELTQAYAEWESKMGKNAPLPVGVVDQIYRKYHPTVNPPPATSSTNGTTANIPANIPQPPPITKTKPLDPEIYKKLVKEGYIIPDTGATTGGTTANTPVNFPGYDPNNYGNDEYGAWLKANGRPRSDRWSPEAWLDYDIYKGKLTVQTPATSNTTGGTTPNSPVNSSLPSNIASEQSEIAQATAAWESKYGKNAPLLVSIVNQIHAKYALAGNPAPANNVTTGTTGNTPALAGGAAAPIEASETAQAIADWESKMGKNAPVPISIIHQIHDKYALGGNTPPATNVTTGTTGNTPAGPPAPAGGAAAPTEASETAQAIADWESKMGKNAPVPISIIHQIHDKYALAGNPPPSTNVTTGTTPNTPANPPAPAGGAAAPTEASETAQAISDWESKMGKNAPVPISIIHQIHDKYALGGNTPPATNVTTGTTGNTPAGPPAPPGGDYSELDKLGKAISDLPETPTTPQPPSIGVSVQSNPVQGANQTQPEGPPPLGGQQHVTWGPNGPVVSPANNYPHPPPAVPPAPVNNLPVPPNTPAPPVGAGDATGWNPAIGEWVQIDLNTGKPVQPTRVWRNGKWVGYIPKAAASTPGTANTTVNTTPAPPPLQLPRPSAPTGEPPPGGGWILDPLTGQWAKVNPSTGKATGVLWLDGKWVPCAVDAGGNLQAATPAPNPNLAGEVNHH